MRTERISLWRRLEVEEYARTRSHAAWCARLRPFLERSEERLLDLTQG